MLQYIELLGTALKIWEHKEKNKYIDAYNDLKKRYYEENNKETPDNSVLDNIEFELFLLGNNLSLQVNVVKTI